MEAELEALQQQLADKEEETERLLREDRQSSARLEEVSEIVYAMEEANILTRR